MRANPRTTTLYPYHLHPTRTHGTTAAQYGAMYNIVRPSSPRIHPLPPRERDAVSRALMDSIGSSATDNTFGTLVRHPSLLCQWISFTVALAVTRVLPPRLHEHTLLRISWLCSTE